MKRDDDSADIPSTREESIELQSFAAQLAQLSPRTDRLDRERLIFLAGQASASELSQLSPRNHDWRRHPVWPAAFAGMSMLSAALLAFLLARPAVNDSASRDFSSFATNESNSFNMATRPTTPQTIDRAANVLSPRAARYANIELVLSEPTELTDASPDVIEPPRPVLTPAAWNELSERSVSKPLPTDSSEINTNQS